MSKPKSPWQPIETAPTDGTTVLLGDNNSGFYDLGWFAVGEWRQANTREEDSPHSPITHWAPIPPLPEGKR
jgi:hypothetical protein